MPNPIQTKTDSTSGRGLTPHLGCVKKDPIPRRFDEKNHLRKRTGSGHANLLNLGGVLGVCFLRCSEWRSATKGNEKNIQGRIFIFMITIHDISWKESSLLIPSEERCSFWVFHKLHLCRQPNWSFHSPLATANLDPNGAFASKDSCLTHV